MFCTVVQSLVSGIYTVKAQKHIKDGKYDKAEKFLIKNRENLKEFDEIEEINRLLYLVRFKMLYHQKKLGKLSKAEILTDEADKILQDMQFEKALDLYMDTRKIYFVMEMLLKS